MSIGRLSLSNYQAIRIRKYIKQTKIRKIMEAEESIMERVEKKAKRWLGQVLSMEEEKWLKQLYQWKPKGSRPKTTKNNMEDKRDDTYKA